MAVRVLIPNGYFIIVENLKSSITFQKKISINNCGRNRPDRDKGAVDNHDKEKHKKKIKHPGNIIEQNI
jgi:hypothetical protein